MNTYASLALDSDLCLRESALLSLNFWTTARFEPNEGNRGLLTLADSDQYQRVIGKVLFLMQGLRPAVCFTIIHLSRDVAQSAERH